LKNIIEPEISIILPVYNGELYLSKSIESILNQTFDNFEFIIINDGSTDNSLKIIKHYANLDSRIILISRDNKGLIYTLNEGIEKSKSEYIVRMDQDDVSLKNRLELQYRFVRNNALDICGGDYAVIDRNDNVLNTYRLPKKDFEILLNLASGVPFPHPSVMMRKSFLNSSGLKYGGGGYCQAEDLDLWLKMYNKGAKFGNVNSILLEYRILTNSMSRVNKREIALESDKKFNEFVKQNKMNFSIAFNTFFITNDNHKNIERIAVKAALRYALINIDLLILYKCYKKVSLLNFFAGLLSFVKLKYRYKIL